MPAEFSDRVDVGIVGLPARGCAEGAGSFTAPELNDIEVSGTISRRTIWPHQTFADADTLDRATHAAVATLNRERTVNPLVIQESLP
jgi:hypothetical protein